jgi:hypothetical protein
MILQALFNSLNNVQDLFLNALLLVPHGSSAISSNRIETGIVLFDGKGLQFI